MAMIRWLPPLVVLGFATTMVWAERPLQPRDEASLVVVGTVGKVGTMKDKFGNDGIVTKYAAEVKVGAIEHGSGTKVGDTIKVRWFHVTQKPSRAFPGAYGHNYVSMKSNAKVKLWLVTDGAKSWEIIYNPTGVEKAKKPKK